MAVVESSFCRICTNHCAIKVTIDDGVVVRVQGDRANPVYRGYTCVKGRSQADYLRHGDRLLRSLKRADDGTLRPIPIGDAMDEIAAELTAAGGIGNGRQMAAALALGADGVWCGSIWLTTQEAETSGAVRLPDGNLSRQG